MRTWAPRGQTPILRVPLTRDHLSTIGVLTATGRVFQHIRTHTLKSADVVAFLRHLLRQISGNLLIIWDGSPIHRSAEIKRFLADGGAQRLHLERLPGYAPDLNAMEGIWRYLKYRELRNVVCATFQELRHEVRLAAMSVRRKAAVLLGCIKHAGYSTLR